MDATHWRTIKPVLEALLEAPASQRPELLDEACGDDQAMRRELLELLDFEDDAEEMFEPAEDILVGGGTDPFLGGKIDSYHVREILGKGGMGTVYLGEKEGDFRQQVALKIIKRGMDTDEVVARFRMERQILAGLRHPNIASLYGGGTTTNGLPYFVMELVEGRPLDEYCDTHRLSLRRRLELFLQVCDAVSAAHRRLVVHRDLKPNNLLVTEEGIPKLLDFGIAKVLGENDDISMVRTLPERRIMTARYASPEQVSGQPITTASDVYSLGVVLFQLLAGHLPYRLDTLAEDTVIRHVKNEEPKRPSTVVALKEEISTGAGRCLTFDPEDVAAKRDVDIKSLRAQLSGDLDAIVLKTLAKEPERRYSSVDQLAEDIQRHLDGHPVRAVPPTWMYRTKRYVQRNTLAVSAASIVFFGSVGAAATFKVLYDEAEVSRQIADAARIAAETAKTQADAARNRAEKERSIAEAVTRLFTDVLIAARPDKSQGKAFSWRDLLDEARKRLENIEDPEVIARFSRTLGQTYADLGELGLAIELADDCLRVIDERFPENPNREFCRINKANALIQSGEATDAKPLLQEALASLESREQEPDLFLAQAYQNLFKAYFEEGELEAAEKALSASIDIKKQLAEETVNEPLQKSLFVAHTDRASILLRLGHAEEALAELEPQLSPMRAFFPADHSVLASALDNLGRIYFRLDRLGDATKAFSESIDIKRRLTPQGNANLGISLINLSKVFLLNRQHAEALDLVNEGERMVLEFSPKRYRILGVGLSTKAEILLETERPEPCLEAVDQARHYFSQAGNVEAWRLTIADNIEGFCQCMAGFTKEGFDLFEESILKLDAAYASEESGIKPPETDYQRAKARAELLEALLTDGDSVDVEVADKL